MRLHYKGKYDEQKEEMPERKIEGSKEIEEYSNKKIEIIESILLIVILGMLSYIRIKNTYWVDFYYGIFYGLLLVVLHPFIKEIIHLMFFKEDVYIYSDFVEEYLLIISNESMSKTKYIMMMIIPDLLLGFVPYIIGLVIKFIPFIVLGIAGITSGIRDYHRVYNIYTQSAPNAYIYMSKEKSYWYNK